MIVWRSATARTGGTVLTAIAEALLRAAGHEPRPIGIDEIVDGFSIEGGSPEPTDAFLRARGDAVSIGGRDERFKPAFLHPMFKLLFVRRDLREAAASYRRLASPAFADIEVRLPRWYDIHRAHRNLAPDHCLQIDYGDLEDTVRVTQRMADFLDLEVSPGDVAAIGRRYDKRAVSQDLTNRARAIMEELEVQGRRVPRVGGVRLTLTIVGERHTVQIPSDVIERRCLENANDDGAVFGVGELIVNLPENGTMRLYPNKDESFRINNVENVDDSRFQLDHVSAVTTPNWRDAFSAEEAARIEAITAPMREDLGY